MPFNRSVDDVLETIRNAKVRERGISVLVGAGCSVTAGIPIAADIVAQIEKRYPVKYARAEEKTYPKCMAELGSDERRGLIAEYVDKARINWAHVAIATLVKGGYIDRVLTTNFDPLVVRACALLNEFPAVYDFAVSSLFKGADIPGNAIFYLNGQRTGFVHIHTADDHKNRADHLARVLEDAGRGRVWIVVGYSGENDPVFDYLAGAGEFDQCLFWVGYRDSEPAAHVRERLLGEERSAYFVRGFDADGFFTKLAQELKTFPPGIIEKPFTHLDECIQTLTPDYMLPGEATPQNFCAKPREMISRAIAMFEGGGGPAGLGKGGEVATSGRYLAGLGLIMAGEYGKVAEMVAESSQGIREGLGDLGALANVMMGNVLSDQAKTKAEEEADRLFAEAIEKYRAALAIKPDMHEALNNWGTALCDQAKFKVGEEADRLFAEAGEKYRDALAIKPDKPEAFYNWGTALSAQAQTKTGETADRMLTEAGEKYRNALALKPDMHEALYNWGTALLDQAQTRDGKEAEQKLAEAGERYREALAIKPDKHEALSNWGAVLLAQAKAKAGEEADQLFAEAGEKFRRALAIKPDMHEALNSWAMALLLQAGQRSGGDAVDLARLAKEKAQAAERIRAGSGIYNLACAHARLGEEYECRRSLEQARELGKLPPREHVQVDPDLASVRERDWFKALLEG